MRPPPRLAPSAPPVADRSGPRPGTGATRLARTPPRRLTGALALVLGLALSGLSGLSGLSVPTATAAPAAPATATTATAAAAAAIALPPRSAHTWGTNGRVRTVLSVGDRVVVAGAFSAVVSPAGRTVPVGNLGVFDPATGTFDLGFTASTDGSVDTMASDGTTLYLGGDFTTVNGHPRTRLAAVSLATGALLSWAPAADGSVLALTLVGGSVIAGGAFSTVRSTTTGTTSAAYLARLTPGGDVSSTPIARPDATVRALAVSPDRSILYVGGDFGVVDGNTVAARRTARLSVATGALDPAFRSGLTNGTTRGPVGALALGGGQLYLAVGGGGGACTSLDPSTGTTLWSKRANGDMQGVEYIGGVTYCGGHFGGTGSFDGLDRQKIAAVDPTTATTLDWLPRVDSPLGVWCMDSDGTSLYVGGDFQNFGTTSGVGRLASLLPPSVQRTAGPVVSLQGFAYDRRVELTWDPPSTDGGSPVTWYVVTRHEGNRTTQVGKRVKTEGFIDPTALDGHTYTYQVTSVTAVGTAPVVTTRSLTPAALGAAPPSPPQQPLALADQMSIGVTWTTPSTTGGSPIVDYVVYRSVDGGGPALVATGGAAARSFRDTAVVTSSSYRYEITARNGIGESSRASTGTVTPLPSRPPTPRLSASAGPGTAATLTWVLGTNTSGAAITKYLVIRDAVRYDKTPATSQTSGRFVDTGVARGRTYRYQVRAVSPAGTSAGSPVITVTIP